MFIEPQLIKSNETSILNKKLIKYNKKLIKKDTQFEQGRCSMFCCNLHDIRNVQFALLSQPVTFYPDVVSKISVAVVKPSRQP